MENEFENGWVNFEWLKELAEKADRMGKIEKQKSQEEIWRTSAAEAGKICKVYYDAFCEAGFTDDQAFDLMTILMGGVASS
jgi:hypothetical protein